MNIQCLSLEPQQGSWAWQLSPSFCSYQGPAVSAGRKSFTLEELSVADGGVALRTTKIIFDSLFGAGLEPRALCVPSMLFGL